MKKKSEQVLGVDMTNIEMPVSLAKDLFRFLETICDHGDRCQLHQGNCSKGGYCLLEQEMGFIGTAIVASTLHK